MLNALRPGEAYLRRVGHQIANLSWLGDICTVEGRLDTELFSDLDEFEVRGRARLFLTSNGLLVVREMGNSIEPVRTWRTMASMSLLLPKPLMVTLAPDSASFLATARPMPEVEPVIIADLPSKARLECHTRLGSDIRWEGST